MKTILQSILLSLTLLLTSNVFCQTYEIYVSDAGNFNNPPWKALKFDENGENPDTFAIDELAWPQDILILEDQNIALISSLNTGRITKHDLDTKAFLGDFATGIGGPTRMKIGVDSLLYVLQWSGNGRVLRYELDGTYLGEFTSTGVTQSIGLDWDSEGNLYVSSWGGGNVRKFDTNGDDLGDFINSSLQGPTNIWFNDAGELLVLNWSGSTAKRFDANGNFIDDFITGLSNPEGIAIYPNGDILIGDGGTSAVKLFDSDGNFIEDIIPSGSGGLLFPNGVTLRDISITSTAEIKTNIKFIQPSLGTSFYLASSTAIQNIESIEVYNSSGQLIESKKIVDTQIWNASKYPEGIYIIIAKSDHSILATQKVMVAK